LRIARKAIRPAELIAEDAVEVPARGRARIPDCARCTDRCCVHKEPDSGIMLSLRDVAHLVDSGLGHLIVGRFTFRRRRGKFLEDIDQMPKLAKQPSGNCHFYDEETGRCEGYGFRPTICRRFPYEIGYRSGSGKPFARFIPWAKCPTSPGRPSDAAIVQMARDAAFDENIAFEDAMLLPDALPELRRAGFGPYLPPEDECPDGNGKVPARRNGS
jgi:Fe-S-cluster containining protein